jgi:peroxiredoxin Q/BCP
VGVSFDPPEVLQDFAEQHGFPFLLLSDQDMTVGELYETKRSAEENHPDYAKRRTYLIDPEGRIVRAYRVTDIPAHPGQVLEDIRSIRAASSG